MKIYPEIGSPKRIVYKKRKKQERNWAFFSAEGEIYALYWVNPLKILKVKKMNSQTWEMEDYFSEKEKHKGLSGEFTIGTQLSEWKGIYYFIGHQKIKLLRKKIYLGKMCALDFTRKKIRPGKYWLIHSFQSLWGSKTKHNMNLFSATYFSGLQASSDSIRLGYGVNDVESGFSKHQPEELWGPMGVGDSCVDRG